MVQASPRSGGQGSLLAAAAGGGLALAMLSAAAPARAQVLQIAPDGHVTTYSGPAVFTADGVTPVETARASAAAGARTARAPAPDLRPAAQAADLSAALVEAVAWRESRLRTDAVSPRGALGEMQLTPATARALGVDPTDPAQNARGGATYLAALMKRYDGDLVKTLAAYDAGPAAVDRYGGTPPYRETRAYVAAVLDRLGRDVAPEAAPKRR